MRRLAAVVAFFVAVEPAVAGKTEGLLTVHDALTSPGKPARLEAKLVQAGLLGQTPLGGEQIEFSVEGRNVGRAMTGGDGRAILEYTPRMRGNQIVLARVAPNPRVESKEAKGVLFSWERRRPLLLIQMSALLDAQKAPFPVPPGPLSVTPAKTFPPVPGAAEELKRMSEFYFNIVYLSWGDPGDAMTQEEMRDWLERHQFPAGLKLRLNDTATALHEKLDELKQQGWDNVRAGVGRTANLAEVLSERRIMAIIMPASDKEESKLPRKTAVARSWPEVRKKLQG
jgi:hypothetical protein